MIQVTCIANDGYGFDADGNEVRMSKLLTVGKTYTAIQTEDGDLELKDNTGNTGVFAEDRFEVL